jgi:Heparinase II/III N-terminus/Heparinase II/III-like protein
MGIITIVTYAQAKNHENRNWENIKSAEDLWQFDPDRVRSLFDAINFQQPDLKLVHSFLTKGDTIKAAEALLDYFSRTKPRWVINDVDTTAFRNSIHVSDSLILDIVRIGNISAKVPKNSDGGWKWNYIGPENDAEFGYSLNSLGYLRTLIDAKNKTEKSIYVEKFDQIVKDWIIHHKIPELQDSIYLVLNHSNNLDYRDIGEVEWRTIQAGQRLGATFPQTFYAFQDDPSFSQASRLLMLISIYEQARFLQKYHTTGHNWTTMEMDGLALAGLAFPEFKEANEWADYALEVMSKEINRQVYPDGVQTELSTKTQWVALKRFESVAENFIKAGRKVAESYNKKLEAMYNYLAYCMRPDGHQPLNNDSDREDLRPIVINAAKKYSRADWLWIATNGKDGIYPKSGPSVTFPWAGIHIMRSGWDKNAEWSFFDTGAYGTGHQHRDKLHLSISAFGKDLLVDGGRYTHNNYFSFDPTVWRGYFRSSFSHNLILADGNGQNEGDTKAQSALAENADFLHKSNYDYAHGVFSDGFENVKGTAIHSRSLLYIKNHCWIVLDHFETDRPRDLQVLWHYSPMCDVKIEEKDAVSVNHNEANLRIIPLGEIDWQTKIIKGQEKPFFQGWYSETYGKKIPNPTVIYSANVSDSQTFAWVLLPAKGEVPKFQTQYKEVSGLVYISIENTGNRNISIIMPIGKDISKVDVKLLNK